jgi:hypothetical protein
MTADDGSEDERGVDAFALVGDGTRVSVLRALAEARREGTYPVGFADLRRRAGVRDSGQFNYHLDRLVGTLLERADGAYRLSYLGDRLVGLLLAGTHESHRFELTADEPCRYCGETLAGTFEDGVLYLSCAEGHYFEAYVSPGAAAERSPSTLLSLAGRTLRSNLDYAFDGVCPFCYGALSLAAETTPGEYGPGVQYRGHCDRCGHGFTVPPELSAVRHPAVVAFYHERGVDVTDTPAWGTAFGSVTATRSTDPSRVELTLTVEGATLDVTLDGTGRVLAVGPDAQP